MHQSNNLYFQLEQNNEMGIFLKPPKSRVV